MKHFIFLLLIAATGCNPGKIRCEVGVLNKTSQNISDCLVDCGRGPVGLGVMSPGVDKIHGDFPALEGASVNVQWRTEDASSMQQATNLLGRGLKRGDIIYIVIDEKGAKLTKGL